MIAPVSNEEKQKLLETKTIIGKTKVDVGDYRILSSCKQIR